ncbi:MAG: DNA/RNA helicase, superfamily II [Parcubacteria group bacterium GW2011_GWF2_38_76]|nr:MAG: DNA/RNA helicase, superfamily II [Parcubacteria group bacterium GW2011_GWF2_38_76]HBM45831.1 ATP-dependent helicase [Patescibacteria group bacterium]
MFKNNRRSFNHNKTSPKSSFGGAFRTGPKATVKSASTNKFSYSSKFNPGINNKGISNAHTSFNSRTLSPSSFSKRPVHGVSSDAIGSGPRPSFKSKFGNKPGFGFGPRKSFSGGSRSSSRNGGFSQSIHTSKFINKNVIDEIQPVFVPRNAFNDFEIDPKIKNNITTKGYTTPTPIQDEAIPHVLQGKDIVGIANTGTGKTGAFLIPLVQKILKANRERVIIVVPTRELAIQIDEELRTLVRGMGMYSTICVGGAPIGAQIMNLKQRYNNFIIGTPGRLKDLIKRNLIALAGFNTIVLDEADRMLDMGFINDMRFMMEKMPSKRHTLFFSATMSPEINALIKEFLNNPVTVSVKTGDTAKNVEQDIVKSSGPKKMQTLHNLLICEEFKKVLIFGRTKHGVEKLSKELQVRGFKAESIHGNKNQSQRQRALVSFKTNCTQILVATDVAARGLDIPDVSHVINYDLPATYDDYVHRIGRTGRGDKKGKALTFVE